MLKPSKNSLFWVIALTVCFIATFINLEVVSTVYLFQRDKKLTPIPELIGSAEDYYRSRLATEGCTWGDLLQHHPYFGFAYRRQGECTGDEANSLGMRGNDFPMRKDPKEHVVLVIGGSVAEMYVVKDYLENALNAEFTSGKIKHFRVVSGGLGAWKYPQQFLFFSLFADKVDTLISLDGFNERYALRGDERIENPTFDLGARNFRTSLARSLRFYVNRTVYRLQKNNFFVRHSRFLFLLSKEIREHTNTSVGPRVAGNISLMEDNLPAFQLDPGTTMASLVEYNFERYLYYFKSMEALAKANGVRTFYFLQPVPVIGKKLTEEEARRNFQRHYEDLYLKQEGRFLALRSQKLNAISLTHIFDKEKESVYLDDIHLNEKGNRILNESILKILRPYLRQISR
jgi:hypothetical protein